MILKNKKKIRIIIGSLNVGGTEKQLLKIINNLAKRSWEIELITLKELGVLGKHLNKKIKVNNLNVKFSFKLTKFFIIISYYIYCIFKRGECAVRFFI